LATTSHVSSGAETKELLIAYLDALTLAEPIQARLWQTAEITVTQIAVLRQLRGGPQSAGRLGQAVGLSPASMTRLLDRLERRLLVVRRRDAEDRRVVEVHLGPEGEKLLGQIQIFRNSPLHRAVEALTRDERRRLTSDLRRLVELTREIAAKEERE
jgi:DNA-binding MarR family transcriptional regulator